MRRIVRPLAVLFALASLMPSIPAGAKKVSCENAQTLGCWESPFSEFGKFDDAPPQTAAEAGEMPAGVSVVVLPNGRILYWDGLTKIEDNKVSVALDFGDKTAPDRTRLLDLSGSAPVWLTVSPEDGGAPDQMFCSDQRLLASGQVLVAGGTRYETQNDLPDEPVDEALGADTLPDGPAELYGTENVRLFDATRKGGRWHGGDRSRDMHYKRWYPTLVTLANGNLFVASGVSKLLYNSSAVDARASDVVPRNVAQTETYDPDTDRWTENGASGAMSLPLYARLHLLPSGEVFYGGSGQMFNPAGEDVDELGWNTMKAYDPGSKSWRDMGMPAFGARGGAFQAQLPLRPPYTSTEFLVAGGVLLVSPGTYIGTPLSEKITVAKGEDGTWAATTEQAAMLNIPRWYSSGVVLPNGHVIAFNGGDVDDVLLPGSARAIRTPELWNGESWVELAPGARDRVYHNSAVLLPDGSVLIGGHSPISRGYGTNDGVIDDTGLANNNLRDPSFERYYPPYLYAGPRPDIASAPAEARRGKRYTFEMKAKSVDVAKVVFSRLPAVTHTTDADQRTVELRYKQVGDEIRARMPRNPALLPPGYYYVFALSAQGVPSVAEVVHIG